MAGTAKHVDAGSRNDGRLLPDDGEDYTAAARSLAPRIAGFVGGPLPHATPIAYAAHAVVTPMSARPSKGIGNPC